MLLRSGSFMVGDNNNKTSFNELELGLELGFRLRLTKKYLNKLCIRRCVRNNHKKRLVTTTTYDFFHALNSCCFE